MKENWLIETASLQARGGEFHEVALNDRVGSAPHYYNPFAPDLHPGSRPIDEPM
jgi:hypothetical protein